MKNNNKALTAHCHSVASLAIKTKKLVSPRLANEIEQDVEGLLFAVRRRDVESMIDRSGALLAVITFPVQQY